MSDSEEEYYLIEPFECDDLAFALGVEWEQFRQKLEEGHPFTELVINANAKRLVRMCERHRRFVEHHRSETAGWSVLIVGDPKDSPGAAV